MVDVHWWCCVGGNEGHVRGGAHLAGVSGVRCGTNVRQNCLDAFYSGQGRAIHILPRHASEVGSARDDVGQLGRLAAGEMVFLEDGVCPQYITSATGNQACPLFRRLL